jgi:hypothetical protein
MWNYRVVRKKHSSIDPRDGQERTEYTYAIHETFYDRNGRVGSITLDSVEPFGENIEELRHSWVMMAEAFGQPILDFDCIPEPEYDRKEDPLGLALDERLTDERPGIPWEEVKKNLEDQWGPFNEEEYRTRVEQERVEKEGIHRENFIGTQGLKKLMDKIYSDYRKKSITDRKKCL